jgi:hypothetical protein
MVVNSYDLPFASRILVQRGWTNPPEELDFSNDSKEISCISNWLTLTRNTMNRHDVIHQTLFVGSIMVGNSLYLNWGQLLGYANGLHLKLKDFGWKKRLSKPSYSMPNFCQTTINKQLQNYHCNIESSISSSKIICWVCECVKFIDWWTREWWEGGNYSWLTLIKRESD